MAVIGLGAGANSATALNSTLGITGQPVTKSDPLPTTNVGRTVSFPERDWNDLIDTVIAEAAGEGPAGMAAVAHVIKNRAAKRGLSAGEVVRQADQFTGYASPGEDARKAQRDPNIRAQAAQMLLGVFDGELPDTTDGADHYHADSVSPSWAEKMPETVKIGAHHFYRSGEKKKAPAVIAIDENFQFKNDLGVFGGDTPFATGDATTERAPDGDGDSVVPNPAAKGLARLVSPDKQIEAAGGALSFVHPGQDKLDERFRSILVDASAELGRGLTITSGYRSPQHSVERKKKTGPGEHSRHHASDINMAGMSDAERQQLVETLRAKGVKRFGLYSGMPDMLHVDMKDQTGGGSTWWMYDTTNKKLADAPGWFQRMAAAEDAAPEARASAKTIVVDENFRLQDGLGMFAGAGNPFQQAAAASQEEQQFTEQRAKEQAQADAVAAENAQAGSRLQQLEASSPGRYEAIDEGELDAWQKRWQEENAGGGVLDTAKNLAAGIGERATDLAGGFMRTLGNAPSPDEVISTALYEMSGKAKPEGRPSREEVTAVANDMAGDLERTKLGYQEMTSWQQVKDSPLRNFIPFALEQGIVSTPDMAAALGNLPTYIAARTGELGQQRAQNNGLANATVGDLLKVLPVATASAMFERIGAKGMFGLDEAAVASLRQIPKEAGKAALKEGATEAAQESIEYAGTTVGTEKGFDPIEMADQAAAGAVGGAGFGGAVRTGTATVDATRGRGAADEAAVTEEASAVTSGEIDPVAKSGPLTRAVEHGQRQSVDVKSGSTIADRVAAAAADQSGVDIPAREAVADVGAAGGRPEVGATVQVNADGIEPFMARVDGYDGDDAILFDAATGEVLQLPAAQIQKLADKPAKGDSLVEIVERRGEDAALTNDRSRFRQGVIGVVTFDGSGEPPRQFQAVYDGLPKDVRDAANRYFTLSTSLQEAIENGLDAETIEQVRSYNEQQERALKPKIDEFYRLVDKAFRAYTGDDGRLPEDSADPALRPAEPIAGETMTELPVRGEQREAMTRFEGVPRPGQRVIVDDKAGGRFGARVITYEEGATEALVRRDDGTDFQVPVDRLFTSSLTPKQVEQEEIKLNPPVERDMPVLGATDRRLGDKTVSLPDDLHARLYDLGKERLTSKRLLGLGQLDKDSALPSEQRKLAAEFKVDPQALGQMADDYRYRVERAAKEARSKLAMKMHGVNPKLLSRWQEEHARAGLQEPAATANDGDGETATWWDGLPLDDRAAILKQTGIKRAPKVNFEQHSRQIREKLAGYRATSAATTTDEPAQASIDFAAHEAATSPQNDLAEPSQAQKEAGNYKLGHIRLGGLDISIENPAGSERKGTDAKGKAWSVSMKSHYGYIRGTVGKDKDHIDVFVRPGVTEIDDSAPIFVVDQAGAGGKGFDEHKVMIGFADEAAARAGYLENYSRSWDGIGNISEATLADFRRWLKEGDTSKPFAGTTDADPQAVENTAVEKSNNEETTADKAGAIDDPRTLLRSKEWKAAWEGDVGEKFGKPHPESPVAFQMDAGWRDAKAGKPPQRVPQAWKKGSSDPIDDYLMGYVAAKEGKARLIRSSDAESEYQKLTSAGEGDVSGEVAPPTVPAVVYHGTSSGGFDSFDTYGGKYGLFGNGGYFTEDPAIALEYTRKGRGTAPTVYRAALNVRNALDMDAPADLTAWRRAFSEYLSEEVEGIRSFRGATNEKMYREVEQELANAELVDWEGAEIMQDGIRSMGHDAITHVGGGRHKASQGTKHRVWIVFDPEQVEDFRPDRGEEERDSGAQAVGAAPRMEIARQEGVGRKTDAGQTKINDFGEVLHGARKHAVKALEEALSRSAVDVAVEPLSKSFPQPDYVRLATEGVPSDTLALIAVMRDHIPARPKKAYKVKEWASGVATMRDFARQLLQGALTPANVHAELTSAKYGLLKPLSYTAKAIEGVSAADLPRAAKWRVTSGSYSVFNGERFDPAKTIYSIQDGDSRLIMLRRGIEKALGYDDTLDGILAKARTLIAADLAGKEGGEGGDKRYTPVSVYRDRVTKDLFIGFKGRSTIVRLKSGFDNVLKAKEYIAEQRDELQKKIDDLRAAPVLRKETNDPRSGRDWREGDIAPADFSETFGFRGVQFGNYVEGDRRQADLNRAYDALMDLADAVGLPPRGLSLEGKLGLAFGARGRGGKNAAAAHYEPGNIVINLTKEAGPGSLAHEWLHALDNYFGRQDSGGDPYISAAKKAGGGARPEAYQAWRAVANAVSKGGYPKRALELDEARSAQYWSKTIELAARSFERYIVDRLSASGFTNDYLANIDTSGGAYPTTEEMNSGIRAAWDGLFHTIEHQTMPTGDVRLFSVAPNSPVISLNGSEVREFKGAQDMPALRLAAAKWYDNNLRGTTAVMKTGELVTFSRKGMGKSTSNGKGDLLLRLVPAIRSIIERGDVVLREPGTKAGVGERVVISAPVEFEGRKLHLAVSVHKTANGRYQYDLTFDRQRMDGMPGDNSGGPAPKGSLPSLEVPHSAALNLQVWEPTGKQPDSVGERYAGYGMSAAQAAEASDIVRKVAGLKKVNWNAAIYLPREWITDGWGDAAFRNDDWNIEVEGYYDPTADIIAIAANAGDHGRVAYHEAFHRIQHRFLTDAERRTLVQERARLQRIVSSVAGREAQAGTMSQLELEAEAFAIFATRGDRMKIRLPDAIIAAWTKIARAIRRIRNYLSGIGLETSEDIFDRARRGEFAQRSAAPSQNPNQRQYSISESRVVDEVRGKLVDLQPAALKAVPLNYFTELARPNMTAVADYLRVKRQLDAYRGKKHGEADAVAQDWLKYIRLGFRGKDKAKAAELADLMHESTLSGIDPSKTDEETRAKPGYDELRKVYMGMPPAGRALFAKVRDTYKAQANELDQILLDNVRKSMQIALDRAEAAYAEEVDKIRASSKSEKAKADAIAEATKGYKAETTRAQWSMKARMTKMRIAFESNRVPEPYFPLGRFGRYFVSVRDVDGEVLHFSRHETAAERGRMEKEMAKSYPGATITAGVTENSSELRQAMDPRLLAEIDQLLGAAGVDTSVMDAIYQRYLQTMPDLSTRKRFIHRKGTAGYHGDALRVFSSHMFHAAHQMGRLKHGMELLELTNKAVDQARKSDDPTRGMTLANELKNRHNWVMNPTGSAVAQVMTSTAFVWFLGVSPAAAVLNMTQTPMMGIPILGARFGGMAKAAGALTAASRDIVAGRGSIGNSKLSEDERRALDQFYDSGLIDRTQSHDIAGVGETGIEYSPLRARVMAIIGWGFHRAEVVNRESTAMAAYRLARRAGQSESEAIDTAHDLTYKTHFDYANSSRPAMLQSDIAKVALVFRAYQVNMLYRVFRDMHQAFKGETPQARKEARHQLAGIVGMMTLMAGTTGVVGFNTMMGLAALAFGDDDDPMDFEVQFRKSVLDILGPQLGGVVLNGVPGHYLGVDLTSRIGMPDLWFRSPARDLQGREEYAYWVSQALGATFGMGEGMWQGFSVIANEGDVARGVEMIAPKWIRDLMKARRYASEGVTSIRGDEILPAEELGYQDIVAQALGISPSKVAETWDRNSQLSNAERRVQRKRQTLVNRFALAVGMKDDEAKAEALAAIKEFNAVPVYRTMAITKETLQRSLKTRARNAAKRDGGVLIENEALNKILRDALPARIY